MNKRDAMSVGLIDLLLVQVAQFFLDEFQLVLADSFQEPQSMSRYRGCDVARFPRINKSWTTWRCLGFEIDSWC